MGIINSYPVSVNIDRSWLHNMIFWYYKYYRICYYDVDEWLNAFTAMMNVIMPHYNEIADDIKKLDNYKELFNSNYIDHGDPYQKSHTDNNNYDSPQNGATIDNINWTQANKLDKRTDRHIDAFGEAHWDKTPKFAELVKYFALKLDIHIEEEIIEKLANLFVIAF